MRGDVDCPVVVTRQRVKTRLSDELRAWIEREGESTLGGLIDTFGGRVAWTRLALSLQAAGVRSSR